MLLLFVASLAVSTPSFAAPKECAKAVVTTSGPCAKLAVAFDLTACGGEALVPASIVKCSSTNALARATANGQTFAVKLSGDVWGDDTDWTVRDMKVTGTANKPAPAPAPASAPSAGAVSPTPPPGATLVAIVAAPTPAPGADTTKAMNEPATSATPATPVLTVTPIPHAWSGDFRFRGETLRQDRQNPGNYTQTRIRARLGVTADLGDDTALTFRMATGPGRVSTNQTLGAGNSAFANYTFLLDRAFFKTGYVPGVTFLGGRVANPFWSAGGSDMVWDSDVNFDGLVATSEIKNAVYTPFASAGLFWINQVTSGDQPSTNLASIQLGAKAKYSDNFKVNFAAVYHHYIGLVGRTNLFGTSAAASALSGNTVSGAANNVWVNTYDLLNVGPEVQTKLFGKPFAVYIDYVQNMNLTTQNKGYLAGFKFGEMKAKGDYQLSYDFRVVEKDAAVDTFTDGDSGGGGTDIRSHRISMGYKVGKNWQASLSFFSGEKLVSNSANTVARDKIHYDLNFSF